MSALYSFDWTRGGGIPHRLSPLPIAGLDVARDLGLAARCHVPVLITGDQPAERERLARLIHYNSARRTRPMVSVRCGGGHVTWQTRESAAGGESAAVVRSGQLAASFDDARHGTLFLDDLCELGPEMQIELSRLLEANRPARTVASVDRQVPLVRLIAGAHRLLCESLEARTFSLDLFYRLNGIHIPISTA